MSRSIEWLNENSYRVYPFVEDSVMTAGSITIPLSAILDISGINYVLSARSVRLVRLEITSTPVPEGIFTFAYDAGTEFSLSVPATAALPFVAILVIGAEQRVTCVFGAGIPSLLANPAGTYVMDVPPKVEPALFVFQDAHRVESITGTAVGSTPATGIVTLVEGYNCGITIRQAANTIVISASRGAGAGIYCEPLDTVDVQCVDVALSINGFYADDAGNFQLLGGEGVTIIPDKASALIRIVGSKKLDNLRCG